MELHDIALPLALESGEEDVARPGGKAVLLRQPDALFERNLSVENERFFRSLGSDRQERLDGVLHFEAAEIQKSQLRQFLRCQKHPESHGLEQWSVRFGLERLQR